MSIASPHQGAVDSVGRGLKEGGAGIQTVLIVSNDGHPDLFASVQAAVDAVPMWNYLRWVIYSKPGVYYGTVIVPEGKDCVITGISRLTRRFEKKKLLCSEMLVVKRKLCDSLGNITFLGKSAGSTVLTSQQKGL